MEWGTCAHLLARLGWFCPVVSEPAKPYLQGFAGSYFLSGVVKNRHFEKWCSKWCNMREKASKSSKNILLALGRGSDKIDCRIISYG